MSYVDLLAVLDDENILVSMEPEGGETSFYKYNVLTDQKIALTYSEILKYKGLILLQFGKNIEYIKHRIDDISSYWNTVWSPDGNAYVVRLTQV